MSERPTTFEAAFAADVTASESLPDTPSTETAPTETPVAATAPPAEPAPGDVHPSTGEPPKERWDAILTNAREKERAAVEADFKSRYAWAEGMQPTDVQQLQRWSRAFTTDPVGWLSQSISELSSTHPHLVPSLHSEAARILAGARGGHAPAEPDLTPDIPVVDQAGNVVSQTFSADRVKQLVQRAVTEAIGKEVAPIKHTFEQQRVTAQERADLEALQAQTGALAKSLEDTLPEFAAMKPEIAKVFAAMPSGPDDDVRAMVTKAWRQVFDAAQAEKAKTATTTATTKVLDDLKTKARAAMPNPGAASVPSTTRPKSFHDPGLAWG